jgi:hypothetical protein
LDQIWFIRVSRSRRLDERSLEMNIYHYNNDKPSSISVFVMLEDAMTGSLVSVLAEVAFTVAVSSFILGLHYHQLGLFVYLHRSMKKRPGGVRNVFDDG